MPNKSRKDKNMNKVDLGYLYGNRTTQKTQKQKGVQQ